MNGIFKATASGPNLQLNSTLRAQKCLGHRLNPQTPHLWKFKFWTHKGLENQTFVHTFILYKAKRSRRPPFALPFRVFLVKVGDFYVMSLLCNFMLESSAKIGNLEASTALGMIEMVVSNFYLEHDPYSSTCRTNEA